MSNYLTLNSVDLNKRAFLPRDLRPLYGNRTYRGSNRVLPGATGRRPLPPVRDQIDVTIEWVCDGLVDETGASQAGVQGLADNLNYYRSLFTTPVVAATGTLPATIHLPDDDYTADVQVWSWDEVVVPPYTAIVLTRIVVPAGIWTT